MERGSVGEVIRDFRREQVIQAARRLFGERGSLEVSVSEIAEAAGVSRSTVYNYFSTREEVLVACLQSGQARLIAAVDDAIASSADPVDQLGAIFEACISHVDQSPAFFRMMTAVTSTLSATEAASVELSVTGVHVGIALRSAIVAAVAAGTFDADVDEAADLIGMVLVGLLENRAANAEVPAVERARGVIGLLASGFLTRGQEVRER
jgi:AcrR family transcriptional regulator